MRLEHEERMEYRLREVAHAENRGLLNFKLSIQRDLKTLSGVFPDLQSDGNKDVAGWSWKHGRQV